MKKMVFRILISAITVTVVFTCVVLGISFADDTVCLGDVNTDGRITLTDCSFILQYIAKWDMSERNFKVEYADSNGDGFINISDVSYLLRTAFNYWNPDKE